MQASHNIISLRPNYPYGPFLWYMIWYKGFFFKYWLKSFQIDCSVDRLYIIHTYIRLLQTAELMFFGHATCAARLLAINGPVRPPNLSLTSSHLSGKIYGDECTILLEVSLVKAFQNILQWFSGLAIVNKNQGPNKEEINRGMWPFMWRSQHYHENGINFHFPPPSVPVFMMCEFRERNIRIIRIEIGCMNQKADQGSMSICLPILGHRSPSPSHFLSGVATILLLVTNSFRQSIKKKQCGSFIVYSWMLMVLVCNLIYAIT